MDIRFGELYSVEVESTEVTIAGQQAIAARLWRYTDEALPQDWVWEWMVQKGEFRGRLPKRIAGFLRKEYDIKLSLENITYIGNVAKRHCHVRKKYTFDFTKSFDWMSGDFGDCGSCFWGARNSAREVLMSNGIIAVRFYRHGDGRAGFARAWIAVLGGGLVVFNAYGLPCRTIAYVLSTLFDMPLPRKVDIQVARDPAELIWLNGDAHVIGLDTPDSPITLEFGVPYTHCAMCDEFVHIEEYMYGEEMCEECYADL